MDDHPTHSQIKPSTLSRSPWVAPLAARGLGLAAWLSAAGLAVGLSGCSSDGGGDSGGDGETGTPATGEATGWESAGGAGGGSEGASGEGADGLKSAGRDCKNGATAHELPGSGVEYCLKASASCASGDDSCPLVVTFNTDGHFFTRVDAAGEDPVIVAELYGPSDGSDVKDQWAELPRLLATTFAGLDKSRVYAIGWSAGVGAITRGLCHKSKMSDSSEYGSTSDIYAALVGVGGCACANDYTQLKGNYHIMTFNGTEDIFGGEDSCREDLKRRAEVNGCEKLDPSWEAIEADDEYAANGTGSSKAEKADFGKCERGEVVAYRGHDEGHNISFKKNFDPKISGYDTAWSFIQGKTK